MSGPNRSDLHARCVVFKLREEKARLERQIEAIKNELRGWDGAASIIASMADDATPQTDGVVS